MAAQLASMVEGIWQEKGMPKTINKDVTRQFAQRLWSGVEEGFGKPMASVDYTTPDYAALAHLQRNVYQFSAAKNWSQMRALTQALVSDDGKLRTKKEFFDAAYAINDEHVNTWLATERDTAIASAQMARQWMDIEANKQLLPLVEFDVVMDTHTSEICRPLHGVIVTVDDPMLSMYTPPNHWRCRTILRQRGSSYKPTPKADIVYPDKMPEMFKVNLGKQRLAFPPKHPYYDGLPVGFDDQVTAVMRKDLLETAKVRLAGKKIKVDKLGEVEINNTNLKEVFNQPHSDYSQKNQYATIADVLLKNAHVVSSAPDRRGIAQAFYYLRVKGLGENYVLVVKETMDGKKVLYSIIDKMK